MKPIINQYPLLIILFLISIKTIAQTNSISGLIIDSETENPITDVSVDITELKISTTTNKFGKFTFNKIDAGEYNIVYSRIGYRSYSQKIFVRDAVNLELKITFEKTELMLGDAVVISTRNSRIIKDVPLPIDLIDERMIEQSTKISSSDLIEEAPGVSLVSDGAWATNVNIRGLSGQNIVYLIDGNRIETATNIAAGLSLIDINNVKNIEVVKGGQSSLYGTGATGGIVNIISNHGSTSNELKFSGFLSSNLTGVNNGKSGSLSLCLSDKIWFANFTATVRTADDSKIPAGTLTNSGFNDNSISIYSGIRPFENIQLTLNYQKFTATNVGIPGGSALPNPAKATYKKAERELFSVELALQGLLPSQTELKIKYYTQMIDREVEIIPNQDLIIEPQAEHRTNGLLVQSDWTLSKNHYLISGVEAWQRRYVGERGKTLIPQNTVVIDKPVPNSKFRTLGFFVQDELQLEDDKFKLNFGARYDLINVTNESVDNPMKIITDGVSTIPPPNLEASYEAYNINNNSWSGNVGFLYSLFQNINLTFNTSYNFRSPSLEERYQYVELGGKAYYGNPKLEPEKGLSYDMGFRIWKEKYSFTADGFVNLFRDMVIDKKNTDSTYQKQNVSKTKLFGFDARLDLNFYKRNILYTSIAYVNGIDLETDQYLPQIPPLNGKFGLNIPLWQILNIDISATFYSQQNKIAVDETVSPGYVYCDLALNFYPINIALIKIQIFVGVENLFDSTYRSHLSTYRGINLTEPGRNIYAKLKMNW